MLEGKAESDLPSLTSTRQLALVLLALRGKGWKAGLERPQGASLHRVLLQELGGAVGWRVDPGERKLGPGRMAGAGRRDGGPPRSGHLHFSDLAGPVAHESMRLPCECWTPSRQWGERCKTNPHSNKNSLSIKYV